MLLLLLVKRRRLFVILIPCRRGWRILPHLLIFAAFIVEGAFKTGRFEQFFDFSFERGPVLVGRRRLQCIRSVSVGVASEMGRTVTSAKGRRSCGI